MKRVMLCLVFVSSLLVVAVPSGVAAPETPPALVWAVTLPDVGSPCDNTSGSTGLNPVAVETDRDGNVYVGVHCVDASNQVRINLYSYTPEGTQRWVRQIETSSGSGNADMHGFGIDPAGQVVVMYKDLSLVFPEFHFAFFNSTDGLGLFQYNDFGLAWTGGFSAMSPIAVRQVDADTLQYTLAVGGNKMAFTCSGAAADDCSTDYEFAAGAFDGAASWQAPAADLMYLSIGDDIQIINESTGAVVATRDIGTDITLTNGVTMFTSANTTDSSYVLVTGSSSNGPFRFHEFNRTTLANVRSSITPAENAPAGESSFVPQQAVLDNLDEIIACGTVQPDSAKAAIVKYNTTVGESAQLWNITIDEKTTTKVEVANVCTLDNTGGLTVGLRQCESTNFNCRGQIKHYDDVGSPRPADTTFDSFPTAAVVPTPTVDAGGGIVNFATSIGFQSTGSQFLFGLVLVIIAMVVVAAAIKSFSEGQPVMLAAGVAAVGMSIFNASIGLWAAWTTVVLVIIAAGIVAFIIRRGVFGFGQSGG